jgi:hypothetical protein
MYLIYIKFFDFFDLEKFLLRIEGAVNLGLNKVGDGTTCGLTHRAKQLMTMNCGTNLKNPLSF